jgi:hypothetical protein
MGASTDAERRPVSHPAPKTGRADFPHIYVAGSVLVNLDLPDRVGKKLRMAATSALTFTTFS